MDAQAKEARRQVKIVNRLGLHARPAAQMVKLASGFSDVSLCSAAWGPLGRSTFWEVLG